MEEEKRMEEVNEEYDYHRQLFEEQSRCNGSYTTTNSTVSKSTIPMTPGQVFHRRTRSSAGEKSRVLERQSDKRDYEEDDYRATERQLLYSRKAMNYPTSSVDGHVKNSKMANSRLVQCGSCFLSVVVRILLLVVFIQIERSTPFKRKIHPEELWLYKNPPTEDYIPASILLPASFIVPFTISLLNYLVSHDRHDFSQSLAAITLALPINGLITSLLKITVGRPRPDFFYRCFPDGRMVNDNFECIGTQRIVNEGRKSFPSGHSSFAFTGFGFVFLYLAAKLHVFTERGRGQAWRFCLAVTPLIVAMLVAISRTCDYHHHWQDVTVGSIIGMLIAYVTYRQYFPSIFVTSCHRPYSSRLQQPGIACCCPISNISGDENDGEQKPLIDDEKETKWI